jgi:hypothetical protein
MFSELVQIDSAELIHANFYQIASPQTQDIVTLEKKEHATCSEYNLML